MYIRPVVAMLLLAAASSVQARDADKEFDGPVRVVDETRPLKADGQLFVSNIAGSIEVIAWDKNEVRITGELGDREQALEITGDVSSLHVEVKVPKRSRDVADSVLRLQVPAGARLELEAVSADIAVQGVRGALRAQSVSGDVNLGVHSPEVEAQTVSGSVTLRAPSGNTRVNTVSGDVHVAGARDKLRLETVSGDVQIEGEALADMQLKSVSGDLSVEASLASTPKISAETLSGEIRFYLAREPDAAVSMHTFSGELQSGYGPEIPDGRKRYETTLGSGKGKIDLNSFSGDIHLHRRRN